jgi:hypothetical protein
MKTISSMASAYSVYTSGGRRVQLGEDLAEMMSFYMRSPDKFEQFINTTIQSARWDERVRKLYESLSHHIKQAFIKYLSL